MDKFRHPPSAGLSEAMGLIQDHMPYIVMWLDSSGILHTISGGFDVGERKGFQQMLLRTRK